MRTGIRSLPPLLVVGLIAVMVLASPSLSQEEGCTKRHDKRLIKRFVHAYNKGNTRLLDSLVAPEPDFQQYRVHVERELIFAEDRSSLLDYFDERHSRGDSLELVHLTIEEYENSSAGFAIGFEVYRETEDPRPLAEGLYGGKGSVDCAIYSWNIGPI